MKNGILVIVFICVLGLTVCSCDERKRDLTIDELKVIAEKGESISLSDFDPYIYSFEAGSGILSKTYPVGEDYVLHIQGTPPDSIVSIRLSTKIAASGSMDGYREIDIRTESIEDFLAEVNE